MEETDVLDALRLAELKKENVRRSFEQLQNKASDLLSFSVQWKDLEYHFDSLKTEIEKKSREVELKDKRLQIETLALEERASKIEAAEAEACDLKAKSEGFRREIEAEREEVSLLGKEGRERKEELRKCLKDLTVVLDTLKKYRSQLSLVEEKLVSRQNLLNARSLELECKEKELDAVRDLIKSCSLELDFKRKEEESLDNSIRQFSEQLESKCTELGEIQKLIREQVKELADKLRSSEAMEWLIQKNLEELEAKEKRHEALRRCSLEILSKERTLAITEESIKKLSVKQETKRKELDQIERSIKNLTKEVRSKEHDLSYLSSSIRESTAVSERVLKLPSKEEDSHMHIDVFPALHLSSDPEMFALYLMQRVMLETNQQEKQGKTKKCIFLLEEFMKVPRQIKPELRSEALKLAFQWKEKKRIDTATTSLCFLLLLVGYNLVDLFDHHEILELAGSVTDYRHAPMLFQSLGLSYQVPGFIQKLIKREHYIPAVRFMCSFKLKDRLSPVCLLKIEIGKLRQCPQDFWKMRSILELIAEYKLEIDLPGDLIAKLMLPFQEPAASVSAVANSATYHYGAVDSTQSHDRVVGVKRLRS